MSGKRSPHFDQVLELLRDELGTAEIVELTGASAGYIETLKSRYVVGTIQGRDPVEILAPKHPQSREELAWADDALCAQVDPELFFPEKGGSTYNAKSVCRDCPVKAPCLEYALTNTFRYGVWGGASERERRKMTPGAA